MRQGMVFSLCLSLTVLLATVFSQQPDRSAEAEENDPAVVVVQARLEGFLPQAARVHRHSAQATAGGKTSHGGFQYLRGGWKTAGGVAVPSSVPGRFGPTSQPVTVAGLCAVH